MATETKVSSQPTNSANAPNYSPAPPGTGLYTPIGGYSPAPKYVDFSGGGGGSPSPPVTPPKTPEPIKEVTSTIDPKIGNKVEVTKEVGVPTTEGKTVKIQVLSNNIYDRVVTDKGSYNVPKSETERFTKNAPEQTSSEPYNTNLLSGGYSPVPQNLANPSSFDYGFTPVTQETMTPACQEGRFNRNQIETIGRLSAQTAIREQQIETRSRDPLRRIQSVVSPENLLGLDAALAVTADLTSRRPGDGGKMSETDSLFLRVERGRTERTEAAKDILIGTGGNFSAEGLIRSALLRPEQTDTLKQGLLEVGVKGGLIAGTTVLAGLATPIAIGANLVLAGGSLGLQTPRLISGEATKSERLGALLTIGGAYGLLKSKPATAGTVSQEGTNVNADRQIGLELTRKNVAASYKEIPMQEGFKVVKEGAAKGTVTILGTDTVYPVQPKSREYTFLSPRGLSIVDNPDTFEITSLESIGLLSRKQEILSSPDIDPLTARRISSDVGKKSIAQVSYGKLRGAVEKASADLSPGVQYLTPIESFRGTIDGSEFKGDIAAGMLGDRPTIVTTQKTTKAIGKGMSQSILTDQKVQFNIVKRTSQSDVNFPSDTDLVIFGMKARGRTTTDFIGDAPVERLARFEAKAKPLGVIRPNRDVPVLVIEPSKQNAPFDFSIFRLEDAPKGTLSKISPKRGATVNDNILSISKQRRSPITLDISKVRKPGGTTIEEFDLNYGTDVISPKGFKLVEGSPSYSHPGRFLGGAGFIKQPTKQNPFQNNFESQSPIQKQFQSQRPFTRQDARLSTKNDFDFRSNINIRNDVVSRQDISQQQIPIQIIIPRQRQDNWQDLDTTNKPPGDKYGQKQKYNDPFNFNLPSPDKKISKQPIAYRKKYTGRGEYTSDLVSKTFNIRGKVPKNFVGTGLELRNLPLRKKRKSNGGLF